jgi:hypothetical protein
MIGDLQVEHQEGGALTHASDKYVVVVAISRNASIISQCFNQLVQRDAIHPLQIEYLPDYDLGGATPRWKANVTISICGRVEGSHIPGRVEGSHIVFGEPMQSKKEAKDDVMVKAARILPELIKYTDLSIIYNGKIVAIYLNDGSLHVLS